MKERGIIFNTENVNAIQEDHKTQTRRVVKPVIPSWTKRFKLIGNIWIAWQDTAGLGIGKCPYGEIGDRLYVRETALYWRSKKGISHVAAFKADGYELEDDEKWTPSIFMPKKYARIWLEITNIRVERVQDITADDSWSEGIYIEPPAGAFPEKIKRPKDFDKWTDQKRNEWFDAQARCVYFAQIHHCEQLLEAFKKLWDSINKKRGHGWDKNDWVWVIEFKVIKNDK